MFAFLVVLHILVSVLLIGAILMQSSKGGGLAGLGGGASTILSGRQAADTLVKATVVLAILFAVLSVSLNIKGLRDGGAEQGIIEKELEQGGGQSAPALPTPQN